MSDENPKPPVRLFTDAGRAIVREPRRGVWQVWLTIAVILIIEIVATAWFLRTYKRPPKAAARPSAGATPVPGQ